MHTSKCEYVCKCMLYFTVGLCSPECECPTEPCFQTNRLLTVEEGSFVRHKHWDCSTQRECACVCRVCAREKEIMCVSLRERKFVCKEEIVSVCEGLFNTVSGVPVYICVCYCVCLCVCVCVCNRDIDLERENRTSVWYFCLHVSLISTDRECVYTCILYVCTSVCVCVSFVFFLFLLVFIKMEAKQLKRMTALRTATFHAVSDADFLSFLHFISYLQNSFSNIL